MQRLRGIIDAAGDNYEIVVHGRESAVLHKHYVDSLALSRRLDGLILIDVPITNHLAHKLAEDRFPTVLVEYPQPGISCVVIDDREGGRMTARYLLERGHRQCAFLGLAWPPDKPSEFLTPDMLRLAGFREALADAGVDLPDQYVKVGYDSAARRQAARELLDLDSRPTAIFVSSDSGAADILPIPAARGLRVPEDVAIIGFDDADFAAYLGLTTVRQHLEESGRVAVQLLRQCLANDASGIARRVTLPLTLVRRNTA
jgi:LacI family transcriptional regulator